MDDRLEFPKGFMWGGATAAEQSEGRGSTNKGKTKWDLHISKRPDDFYDKTGPEKACDFFNKYKDDLKLFAKIGSNSIRLGFSWSRIFPDGKNLSKKGVNFYHDVLKHCKINKIKPVMTLFHFDMPKWAMDMGGWENKDVVDRYAEYADFIFSEYGDEVYMYATMNEPIVPIIGGYFRKFQWPMIKDEKRGIQAAYGTILAHAKAVNIFNQKYKNKLKAKIGVIINVANTYPKDNINYSKNDLEAAKMNDLFFNHSFLKPMVKGEIPKEIIKFLKDNFELMPKHSNEEIKIISKVSVDFIGVNFYMPQRVSAPDANYKPEFKTQSFAKPWYWKKAVMNVFRGWEIYPKALYDTAKIIHKEYDNIPFYISENGMGVQNEHIYRNEEGIIQDDYRIAFLNEHLYWCHKAIQEGANCFGYHMWAIIDCWSWLNGFKNRYGFVEVDLETMQRKPKKSADWLKKSSSTNSIKKSFKSVQEVMDLSKAKYQESIGSMNAKKNDI